MTGVSALGLANRPEQTFIQVSVKDVENCLFKNGTLQARSVWLCVEHASIARALWDVWFDGMNDTQLVVVVDHYGLQLLEPLGVK